jgi:hypothetical protein
LRKFNLSDESLHDLQRFGQRSGIELRDRTSHTHDVDVGEILREIRKKVEDPLEKNIQMPMEAGHISTGLGKPISPITGPF